LEVGGNGIVGVQNPGPVSRVVGDLANEFAAMGHDVTVADSRADAPRVGLRDDVRMVELDLDCRLPITLRRTRLERWKNHRPNRRYDRAFADELERALNLSQFDIIHTHMPLAPLGRMFSAVCSEKHVHTCHTATWADITRYKGARGAYRHLRLLIGKWTRSNELGFMSHTSLNVGLGSFLGLALEQLSPDTLSRIPLTCIPNGINLELWQPIDTVSARQHLGLETDDFVVVMVGRLEPTKGHKYLIEAVRSVSRQIPGLRVFMIGRTDSEQYLREMKSLSVGLPIRWCGHTSRDELVQLISAADVSVVTSEFDTQPTVVLESLALGVPVLASDVGAVAEMISPDVGFVVERGDSAEIGRVLVELSMKPESRARYQAAARTYVESAFSWRREAQLYINAFEGLLGQRETSLAEVEPTWT
jgi:glycosyltransferase involved in cell wall biosynthesis